MQLKSKYKTENKKSGALNNWNMVLENREKQLE